MSDARPKRSRTSPRATRVRLRTQLRAFPAMFRVGLQDALAYRAEMLVWILSTTMPLVMLALFHAVARDAPIGRFDQQDVVAYFLAMFIVRQLTGSWAVWLINMEVKDGTLALRLLRPVHPLLSYAAGALAELPVRGALSVPLATVVLWAVAREELTRDPWMWIMFSVSVVGGWLLTFLANVAIGCLALFVEQSTKIMDVWLALFFVFSGYMIPVELFPPWLRALNDWMPFRYQLGLPVELATGAHDAGAALALLGRQWAMIAAMLGLVTLIWRRGVRRFDAYGG